MRFKPEELRISWDLRKPLLTRQVMAVMKIHGVSGAEFMESKLTVSVYTADQTPWVKQRVEELLSL